MRSNRKTSWESGVTGKQATNQSPTKQGLTDTRKKNTGTPKALSPFR